MKIGNITLATSQSITARYAFFQLLGDGVETTSGRPHPLESAVSRQLDSIDLDDGDDWGLQEVRATSAPVTMGTISMVTDSTHQPVGSEGGGGVGRMVNGELHRERGREQRHSAVDG